ncbi:MAG TPA: SRPBCC family protein [Actinomycetes bacterium]
MEIKATPERVWQVLTDFAAYPDWNPFITRASGTARPSERLHLRMQPPGLVERDRPGRSLQVLQVAMAVERPWTRHARQHQSQVCGCTGAKLRPAQQAGANTKPEAHGALAARPSAEACRTRSESGPRHLHRGGPAGSSALAGVVAKPVDGTRRPTRSRRGPAAWHTQSAAVVLGEKGPGGPGEEAVSHDRGGVEGSDLGRRHAARLPGAPQRRGALRRDRH